MIYQKHIIPELFDIGHIFYSMASGDFTYHQYEKGQAVDKEPAVKYQKWEQVDDRYDSLFGSTYKIPIEDYPTNADKISITVVGDKWLCTNKTIADVRILDRWDNTYTHHCNYPNDLKNTLRDELPKYFPNATINFVGNYSANTTTYNTLDNVYAYLQGLSEYPDYLIFNGVDESFIRLGGDWDAVSQLLTKISNFCLEHLIRALCVYTPTPSIFVAGTKLAYLKIQSLYYPGFQSFQLNDWFMRHMYVPEDYAEYGNNTDRLDQYKLPVVVNQGLHSNVIEWYVINSSGQIYREVVYNTIKRYILEQFLCDYKTTRKCYYVSLSHKDVTKTTYGYYHGDKAKVYHRDQYPETMITDIPIYGHPKYVFRSKYFERNNPWNLFSNTGEFIAIALHTGFIENAWLCEQRGSTCGDEGSKVRQSVEVSALANLMRVLREREGAETRINPPVMQGTGTSWLTISDDDKERYKNQLGYKCPIEVYISRDDYNFTITTRIHSEEGYQDLYQSVAAGKMTQTLDNYPLYVAGGTTGLKNDVYSYIPVSGTRTEIHGCVYDLSMGNVALSNTTANHPTKFYDCIFSNFKVFSEHSGKWRSIFLHSQGATVQPNYNCSIPNDHAIWLNEPVYNVGRSDGNAFPCSTDLRYRIGSKWLKKHGFQYTTGQEPMFVEPWWYDSPLQSFRGFTKPSWYDNDCFYCSGNITTFFANWDWRVPCGEITYPTGQVGIDDFEKVKSNWRLTFVAPWESGKQYQQGDTVAYSGSVYTCLVDHTSADFTKDKANWREISAWNSKSSYSFGDITSASVWEKVADNLPDWQLDYDYKPMDMVLHDGIAYICTQWHSSSTDSFEEDQDKWEVIENWGAGKDYAIDDLVYESSVVYKCLVTHTSNKGSFINDMVGIFEFTGKKYLVVPCGWEERLYWYDGHYVWTTANAEKLNNTWNNDSVLEEWEKNKLEFNRRRIKDKLFVVLEDNYYPRVYHKPIDISEPEPDPRQRIVLFFQFWCVHYYHHGDADAVVHSAFDSDLQRTFYVNKGWNNKVGLVLNTNDIPYTDWRYDVYEGLIKYCNRAESFASKFYVADNQTGRKRGIKFGDTLTLANTTFFADNFNSTWPEVQQWITAESLGNTSNMNASGAIIHAAMTATSRPSQLLAAFKAFGVDFPSNTSIIPVGFPISSKYDDPQYLTLLCNFFYRWMMPVVLYTEVAGRYKLNQIMQDLDSIFLPYTQGTDGFKLVYKAKYFRQQD